MADGSGSGEVPELQPYPKILQWSVDKLSESRRRKCGIDLRKNLLIANMIYKARTNILQIRAREFLSEKTKLQPPIMSSSSSSSEAEHQQKSAFGLEQPSSNAAALSASADAIVLSSVRLSIQELDDSEPSSSSDSSSSSSTESAQSSELAATAAAETAESAESEEQQEENQEHRVPCCRKRRLLRPAQLRFGDEGDYAKAKAKATATAAPHSPPKRRRNGEAAEVFVLQHSFLDLSVASDPSAGPSCSTSQPELYVQFSAMHSAGLPCPS